MDVSEEAQRAMRSIAERARAGEARELLSHLHESAAAHAERMGRDRIEAVDVDAALAEAGGERTLARTFARRPRAPLSRRAAAHALDVLVVYAGALFLWALVWVVARLVASAAGQDTWWQRPDPFQFVDFDDIPGPREWSNGVPVASALNGVLVGLFVLGIPFLYFLLADLRTGRTMGKRTLGLRLVAEQAHRRVGWGAATLRALLKASLVLAPLLALDALFGRGERWSDRALGVTVVEDAVGIGEAAIRHFGDARA